MSFIKKKWGKVLIIFILIFLTEILICKNTVLFSFDSSMNMISDEGNMYNYQKENDIFIPQEGGGFFCIGNVDIITNEVRVHMTSGIQENSNISLYLIYDDGEELIETRTIRKGYEDIKFRFTDRNIKGIRIVLLSVDNSHFVNVPEMNIQVGYRSLNIIQSNWQWIFKMIVLFMCAAIVTCLIVFNRDENRSIQTKQRDSNLELLRVLCMLVLIAHHYAVHGGLLNTAPFSLPHKIGLAFLPLGKICFISFIAISTWFLVDGKINFQRFFKTWMQVLFYSVLFTIVTYAFGGILKPIDFVSSFFVMIGNSHGYAASYLIFILLFPMLYKVTKDISKKQARYLMIILFWIQVASQILKAATGYNQPVYSEVTLFILCYFISLNLKKWPIKLFTNRIIHLFMIVLTCLLVVVVWGNLYRGNYSPLLSFGVSILADESSVFNILAGYSLFYLFKDIKIGYNKVINTIAEFMFGILLIHDHNFFRKIFWNDVVGTNLYFYSEHFFGEFVLTVIGIFIVCATIDFLRKELLEKKIVRTQVYQQLIDRMNTIWKE